MKTKVIINITLFLLLCLISIGMKNIVYFEIGITQVCLFSIWGLSRYNITENKILFVLTLMLLSIFTTVIIAHIIYSLTSETIDNSLAYSCLLFPILCSIWGYNIYTAEDNRYNQGRESISLSSLSEL